MSLLYFAALARNAISFAKIPFYGSDCSSLILLSSHMVKKGEIKDPFRNASFTPGQIVVDGQKDVFIQKRILYLLKQELNTAIDSNDMSAIKAMVECLQVKITKSFKEEKKKLDMRWDADAFPDFQDYSNALGNFYALCGKKRQTALDWTTMLQTGNF